MSDIKDVVIIGAGALGCAVARELSRYELDIAVLEKSGDVASATSGRNSAVVHAGFNNKPGSLMARFCVEGNKGFESLCKDLDVTYKKTGKILVAFDEEDLETLKRIIETGKTNGCEGLRLISKQELESILPGVGGIGGMLSPNTAIFNPFTYCIALAENAHANGAEFYFDNEVTAISKDGGVFTVTTSKGTFKARYIVNCAGLFCAKISEMAGVPGYTIYPCRGEYIIFDKDKKNILPLPVYPAPKKGIGGLGVHLTPTTDGNIIAGPSAEYIDDPEDYSSTAEIQKKLRTESLALLPEVANCPVIGNYSGIRPKQAPESEGGFRDFVIKEEEKCPGLINLIGIESPGLTSSVPIARYLISEILCKKEELREKKDFIAKRKANPVFRELSEEEQVRLIKENPEYGDIVCRCQNVSRAEIRNAIENPLGVKTVAGVKYRAWATTGRCNGGYCLQKISRMLVEEYGLKPEEIRLRGEKSVLFAGEVK